MDVSWYATGQHQPTFRTGKFGSVCVDVDIARHIHARCSADCNTSGSVVVLSTWLSAHRCQGEVYTVVSTSRWLFCNTWCEGEDFRHADRATSLHSLPAS